MQKDILFCNIRSMHDVISAGNEPSFSKKYILFMTACSVHVFHWKELLSYVSSNIKANL